jgi:PPOX class probable F420-dependent enzyme
LDVLGNARTILLTTYRRDGTAVPTPVWVVRFGDELRVWTNPRTGKYKRIRNNPRVTVAPCSFRGTPRGPAIDGSVRLLADGDVDQVLEGIKQKYGVFGRLSIWQSGLGIRYRGWPKSSGLAIKMD